MTAAGLQAAADDAFNNPGDDTVQIDPGEITISSSLNVSGYIANNLMIVGAANHATTLHFTHTTSGAGLTFNSSPGDASGLSNLKVALDGPSSQLRWAIALLGGSATDVDFSVEDDANLTSYALHLVSSASCSDCRFKLAGSLAQAVRVINSPYSRIGDLTIERVAGSATPNSGILIDTNSLLAEIDRARISGVKVPLNVMGGTLKLRDSLIDLGDIPSAHALDVNIDGVGPNLDVRLDGVTAVGSGAYQEVVELYSGPGNFASATVTNSLLMLTGTGSAELRCGTSELGLMTVTRTFKNPSSPGTPPDCNTVESDNVSSAGYTTGDVFVDAAAGDYRLRAAAPVIDKGDPATATAGRGSDLAGLARFVDGDANGSAVIDLGAFERQPSPPDPTTAAPAPTPPPTLALARQSGKASLKKLTQKPAVKTSKSKLSGYIKLTASAAVEARVTLLRSKAGYKSGAKCRSRRPAGTKKPKRCDLALGSALNFKLPAGTSYFTLGSKWGSKKLKPGKYKLSFTGAFGTRSSSTLTVEK